MTVHKILFKNCTPEEQLIVEDRLISNMRIMQESYIAITFKIIGWLLTINAGSIAGSLSYLAAKNITKDSLAYMHKALITFSIGLFLSMSCLIACFFIARLTVHGYREFTKDIRNSTKDLNINFEQSCAIEKIDNVAYFSGIGSFICIGIGMYLGFRALNIFWLQI